ncbi:hypothetical protein F4803DRAFT_575280 [Xylaria telfairii]|nr:hypothetical protein F4803DRAFT_575280 [Xylaria telfairii]
MASAVGNIVKEAVKDAFKSESFATVRNAYQKTPTIPFAQTQKATASGSRITQTHETTASGSSIRKAQDKATTSGSSVKRVLNLTQEQSPSPSQRKGKEKESKGKEKTTEPVSGSNIKGVIRALSTMSPDSQPSEQVLYTTVKKQLEAIAQVREKENFRETKLYFNMPSKEEVEAIRIFGSAEHGFGTLPNVFCY